MHYSNWTKQKRNSTVNQVSDFVPANILFFNSFVEEFFAENKTHAERMEMIDHNRPFLDELSFGGQKGNVFGNLFDMAEVAAPDGEAVDELATYADVDDIPEDDE